MTDFRSFQYAGVQVWLRPRIVKLATAISIWRGIYFGLPARASGPEVVDSKSLNGPPELKTHWEKYGVLLHLDTQNRQSPARKLY